MATDCYRHNTQPTACDALHLFLFIISLYSSWASHPIPYYAHPARNQRSRCLPRAPNCLLPCSYIAPTLLQPTLLLSSSYLPPTATARATVWQGGIKSPQQSKRMLSSAGGKQVQFCLTRMPHKTSIADTSHILVPPVQGYAHQSLHLGKFISDFVPGYEPVRAELHSAGTKLRVDR